MIQNLHHLLTATQLQKLTNELDRNVVALFELGMVHFNFATSLSNKDWRQKTSRLYYAAYNVRRAIQLKHSGSFSTDSSDHRSVEQLPDQIERRASHVAQLKTLRDDRNLCDYDAFAKESDLVISVNDAVEFTTQFIADSKSFLSSKGVSIKS
ncbi:MAG: hypothetical protein ACOY6K_15650 [Pseudomonadota bacterium]